MTTSLLTDLDPIETVLATKRIKRWPSDWQDFVRDLPVEERRVVGLCVALLDARPDDGSEGSEE